MTRLTAEELRTALVELRRFVNNNGTTEDVEEFMPVLDAMEAMMPVCEAAERYCTDDRVLDSAILDGAVHAYRNRKEPTDGTE